MYKSETYQSIFKWFFLHIGLKSFIFPPVLIAIRNLIEKELISLKVYFSFTFKREKIILF